VRVEVLAAVSVILLPPASSRVSAVEEMETACISETLCSPAKLRVVL